MNKAIIVGVVAVVLIIAVGAAYELNTPKSYPPTSTSTQIEYTTVSPSTAASTSPTTTAGAGSTYNVNFENSPVVGRYLTNSSGFTLYIYTLDHPNRSTSACYSSCAMRWSPFYTTTLSLAPELNATYFSTITRTDGSKQLIYKGYPLYLFVGDHKAGDISGQGVEFFIAANK